jgi:hypothetical protein
MDLDTIALMKLKKDMRLRQQRHAAGPRPAHEAMTPQIKMIVSNSNSVTKHASSRRATNKRGRPEGRPHSR